MSLRRAPIQRAAFQRVGYDESFLLIRQGSELTVSARASLRMKTRGYLRTAVDINKTRNRKHRRAAAKPAACAP